MFPPQWNTVNCLPPISRTLRFPFRLEVREIGIPVYLFHRLSKHSENGNEGLKLALVSSSLFYDSPTRANYLYTACEQHCRVKGSLTDADDHRLGHLVKSGRRSSMISQSFRRTETSPGKIGGCLLEVERSANAKKKETRFVDLIYKM